MQIIRARENLIQERGINGFRFADIADVVGLNKRVSFIICQRILV